MRVTILSLGPLEHDSRLLRLARSFRDAGHMATLMGLAPAPRAIEGVSVLTLDDAPGALGVRAGMALRKAPAALLPWSAPALYWLSSVRWRARAALLASRPDAVIAVDWKTLPIAHAVRRRTGCRVIYDCHEFATGEFLDNRKWRLLVRPHVREIERRGIAGVDGITTVSDGLAARIAALYRLARPPVVVRNIPDLAPMPFRATGAEILVLYQGLIAPQRGLEASIASVRDWAPGRRLLIRGFGRPGYIDSLRALAAANGVQDRVSFAPAVPPDAITREANAADIGLFVMPGQSAQAEFVLPNKLFEYMAAGLALAVSDLPEMRRVVTTCGCGVLTEGTTPDAIAAAINRLEPAAIDAFKRASLEAAAGLSFRTEFEGMLALAEGRSV